MSSYMQLSISLATASPTHNSNVFTSSSTPSSTNQTNIFTSHTNTQSSNIHSFVFTITKAHIKESLQSPFVISCEGYIE
ncbi:hypothetical protein, partial [uncultured Helicobacter sp.]|uniref:hypothetical protein n=1 Tax=uncultured Helicobacter sp. TaxID=175537 RepID=UPI003751BCA0